MRRWYRPGYLALGDAAHAMSPVGGIGINVAIQDAVVAANLLWAPLLRGEISTRDLARVQRHRTLTVRVMQRIQTAIQNQILRPALTNGRSPGARLLLAAPGRRLLARLITYGLVRPRVRAPARAA